MTEEWSVESRDAPGGLPNGLGRLLRVEEVVELAGRAGKCKEGAHIAEGPDLRVHEVVSEDGE